jgi:hypothetical protein
MVSSSLYIATDEANNSFKHQKLIDNVLLNLGRKHYFVFVTYLYVDMLVLQRLS